MLHSDCGASGGLLGGFGGDAGRESKHHEAEMQRAADTFRATLWISKVFGPRKTDPSSRPAHRSKSSYGRKELDTD